MHLSSRFHRTIKVIDPAVIGADKGCPVATRLLADRSTSVPTDVVHRMQFTIGRSSDDDRILANFKELIVSGIWQLALVQRIDPAFKN